MRVLLIGYSDIAQRRVIPALAAHPQVTALAIATRSRAAQVALPDGLQGQVFVDAATALATQPDLVYISTRNSEHEATIAAALRAGCHVVVDKPACLSVDSAETLIALADQHNLLIAEATVYAYHRQIEALRSIFYNSDDAPKRLSATFSFPPLRDDNFRLAAKFGGGALNDLGPYAMSLGRIFFTGAVLTHVTCQVGSTAVVETAFSVLAHYSNGGTLVGHFGFDTGYCNTLQMLGNQTALTVEQVYTTPPAHGNVATVQQGYERSSVHLPADNAFGSFFDAVFGAIERRDFGRFADDMLTDAHALHQLRTAAQQMASFTV